VRTCTVDLGRWFSYAAAAAATALVANNDAEGAILYSGVLNIPEVGASPPHFQIHYAAVNTLVSNGHEGNLAIGGIDHEIQNARPSGATYNAFALFDIKSAHAHILGRAVRPYVGYASKLALGANISAGPFFPSSKTVVGKMATNSTVGDRRWTSAGMGFIGFSFNRGAGVEYGWVRVTIDGPKTNNLTVVDYAYGTPGQAIEAGAYALNGHGGFEFVPPVPEPASLGLLATGAIGLLAMRWSRKRMLAG